VIRSFRHKGLARFFRSGSVAGINPAHAGKLRLLLGQLDASAGPPDMTLPGIRLHPLRGGRQNRWSARVSGNWRLTFRFAGEDVVDVDDEDYH
jgi:proteic killer suppression protein